MTHSHVCHDSLLCVPWLIHMCAMTHSHVWHDSFICVPWLIHMCAMTHSYVCHDSFICVPWLIHMCAMTHSHVCHDSFICDTYDQIISVRHMHVSFWPYSQPHLWSDVPVVSGTSDRNKVATSDVPSDYLIPACQLYNRSCLLYVCYMCFCWQAGIR